MARKSNKEVEAIEEVVSTSTIKLLVNVAFTDKYDDKKHYNIGDEIEVDQMRANELLADIRNLVVKK